MLLLGEDTLFDETSNVAAQVASHVATCESEQSDDTKRQWGGSKKGKAPNVSQKRMAISREKG